LRWGEAALRYVMKANLPFLWVVPAWCGIGSGYLMAACFYLWKMTGVNMWKVWWQTNASHLKTEHRFAEEVRKFPRWHFGYQMVKWGTFGVIIGYLVCVFLYVSRR